ncbi:MAG: GAF domain-containing sensor histidine kinase [Capsulimonadales bacterium]|nr:GAF domain-containing sensor histidine kinase [Capsulimonadales bacterium]
MSPRMVETLYSISLLFSPEPETVFRRIAEVVSEMYGNTMAMINLMEGDCLRFRTVVNRHPAFKPEGRLPKRYSLCQFSIGAIRPLLIQNATEHPDFCNHVVVRMKLRRYLGVPICRSDGSSIGTLCFLDDRVDDVLGDDDIQFLSFLAMRVSVELERERLIEERIAEQRAYAERLQATAQEKRRFVSMVIHDLRHPLAALQAGLYLLKIETDSDHRDAHLRTLEGRVRALGVLLDELVLYDQVEAGRRLLHIEPISLGPLVEDCIAQVTGMTGDDRVPVRVEIAPEVGSVETDARKLKHILMNLLTNALKFTACGRVIIRVCDHDDENWRLEVEDTGIGMTEAQQRKVFDEYVSGAEGGIGLGLTIAHRLWTELRATVTLTSEPGQGTRFRLVFPRSWPASADA